MAVTMKDIAKAAGVSVQTVSRAFNDRHDISSETKKRIHKIAKELNYLGNSIAISLRTNVTKTLGIIVPDISDPAYVEVLQGCSNAAREHGYQILIYVTSQRGANVDEDLVALRTLMSKRVDGLLLQPEHEDAKFSAALNACPIPFVLYSRYPLDFECDFVTSNHSAGAYQAASHLFEKGHKNIKFFVRYPRNNNVLRKIDGCLKAAKDHGLSGESVVIIDCGDSLEDAYEKVKYILGHSSDTTAIYTWDDEMAIGAARAILDAGYKIGQDIALIGHNNIKKANYLNPPLTTVRERMVEIGEMATLLLIKKIKEKDKVDLEKIELEPELLIRQTT